MNFGETPVWGTVVAFFRNCSVLDVEDNSRKRMIKETFLRVSWGLCQRPVTLVRSTDPVVFGIKSPCRNGAYVYSFLFFISVFATYHVNFPFA